MPDPKLILLGNLKSGQEVYDRPNSHLQLPLEIIKAALARIDAAGRTEIKALIDFGYTIGQTTCVSTDGDSEIIYAFRPGRRGPTRFVKNAAPKDVSKVVVILGPARNAPGKYILRTAFAADSISEKEPWDPTIASEEEFRAAAYFWIEHALIFDPTAVESYAPDGVGYWTSSPYAAEVYGTTYSVNTSKQLFHYYGEETGACVTVDEAKILADRLAQLKGRANSWQSINLGIFMGPVLYIRSLNPLSEWRVY